MHRGRHYVGLEGYTCILETVAISLQYWLVGRQVKCHLAAASLAVEGEVVDLGTSARSHHNFCLQTWRTCSRTISDRGMSCGQWEILIWPIVGAFDYRLA